MKKSILILTTFYKPFVGGAEVFVAEMTKRLSGDFSFIVLTARNLKSLPRIEKENGIMIYRLGLGFRYDKFIFPLLALIKSYFLKFDLVYAIMASYAGAGASLIKIFRGKKYVLNLQSGTMDTDEYLKIIKLFWPFYKKIHTGAAAIHAISYSLKERAEKLGVIPEKIFIIPNGLDLKKFEINSSRSFKRIVTVARLEKVKGVEYLIRAVPLVAKKFPEAEFIIAGDGSERNFLESLALSLRVENCVKFIGRIDHGQVPQLLNSVFIFVCPSIAEGMGIVILEAMASGLAVVGAKVGGIPDIIKHGVNGLLVESQSERALAEAIIGLLEKKELSDHLIKNGREFVKNYDWEKVLREVKHLIIRS